MQLREEPETLEFRAWLADTEKLNDAELQQRLSSLNSKIARAAKTNTGKALRILVTSVIPAAVGVIPGVAIPAIAAGLGLTVLHQFLWDRLCRESRAAAFVSELYPSIFAEHTR